MDFKRLYWRLFYWIVFPLLKKRTIKGNVTDHIWLAIAWCFFCVIANNYRYNKQILMVPILSMPQVGDKL